MKTRLVVAFWTLLLLSFTANADEASSSVDESLPPELQDIDLATRRDGFIQLFDGYNPRGFSIYSMSVGLKLGSGFEYYSGGSIYGQPGNAEPAFYKTKQNLYYAPWSDVPLE